MQTADQHVFIVSTHINATHTHTHMILHIYKIHISFMTELIVVNPVKHINGSFETYLPLAFPLYDKLSDTTFGV